MAERYWEARWRDEAAENDRLRKGIRDFLDGNYEHPRSYRVREGAGSKCPHGVYYYEECCSCNEEHFSRLLGEAYTVTNGDRS